ETKDADNADGSDTDEADVFERLALPRALTSGFKQINQDTGLIIFYKFVDTEREYHRRRVQSLSICNWPC
ncbi:hypothetical protein BD408DRAFT_412566, partial [Parasitella parasitica]